MPKTIGEFLKTLLVKAGVKVEENEALVNELAAPSFSTLTISDDIEKGIDTGLLSMETAKNNHPELKKVYFAQAYNGLDSEVNTTMEELQLDDAVKNRILNERSSPKRAALLTKVVKELEEKKKQTTNDTAKESLQNQINELRGTLAREQEGVQKIKEDYENKIKSIHTDSKVESLLNSYKTVYDELPGDVKSSALKALIQKELQDSDAELKIDDKGQLALVRKDGSNVYGDDHRQLNPQLLIDKVLSKNKILKVSDPNAQKSQQGNNSQNGNDRQVVQTGQDGRKVDNSNTAVVNRNLQAIKDMEEGAKVSII